MTLLRKATAFVGLSHMGLVTSISWASLHPPVIGIDNNKIVSTDLQKGKLPFYEPSLDKLFAKVRKNYHPSANFSELKNMNLVFFTLDTSTDKPDELTALDRLIDMAMPHLSSGVTIVVMSQVPVGFTRKLESKIKKGRPKLSFSLYYWVNTIVIGNAIERFINPERIIIGGISPSTRLTPALRTALKLFSCPVLRMSYESAEMTKSAVNLYLAASITASNTLADFCEVTGADINEIIPALRLDKRIGKYAYLNPTLRIAGGHLERELLKFKSLGKRYSMPPGITECILELNEHRYRWVHKKLKVHLAKDKKKPIICLWGLAYKKGSLSTNNAASIKIIETLSKKAKLNTYDPLAIMPKKLSGYTRFKDKYKALSGADCLLILTNWEEFREVNISRLQTLMRHLIVIDCVGILSERKKQLNNFTYITMGVG